MTFLITEDEALRDLLKGMTVTDDKSTSRSVGVWFGQPDTEIRQQQYPFVTIDMIDISEGTERVMNAQYVKPWYLEPTNLSAQGLTFDDWGMFQPLPMNIDYQVTTFARQPRHDRQIISQILGSRLPFRFGSLVCKEKQVDTDEWDATVRRLDMIGMAKRDTVESGKRLFMNMYTVRVSSEIPAPFLPKLYKRVSNVLVEVGQYDPNRTFASPPSFKETINISVPAGTP